MLLAVAMQDGRGSSLASDAKALHLDGWGPGALGGEKGLVAEGQEMTSRSGSRDS